MSDDKRDRDELRTHNEMVVSHNLHKPNSVKALELCEHENAFEDDSESVICRSCKEWTCKVKCEDCDDVVSSSACCG